MIDVCLLRQPEKFVGYTGRAKARVSILLRNNGRHVALILDHAHPSGSRDQAILANVQFESAIFAIMDHEDSVACIEIEDKVQTCSHWLVLIKVDLGDSFEKSGTMQMRRLNADHHYTAPDGSPMTIKERAHLWVRNLGHLMTNSTILDQDVNTIPEGLTDAAITVLIAQHDLKCKGGNSVKDSVYVVKQKNHVAFINTGFFDRIKDEIHTSMEAGPFSRENFIKHKTWITAYENQNVNIDLECWLSGKTQIGEDTWAAPDMIAAMLEQKIEHPNAGANCAWVPSPTAATLHALHYYTVEVFAVQEKLKAGGRRAYVDALLDIPVATYCKWSDAQIIYEVENNTQGILGYVVSWVDHGMGCSKVSDLNDLSFMEDRATCQISSQHLANWLHHGVVYAQHGMSTLRKMAEVMESQNAADANYVPTGPNFSGITFQAATTLVFKGSTLPSGYAASVLHQRRLELKAVGWTCKGETENKPLRLSAKPGSFHTSMLRRKTG